MSKLTEIRALRKKRLLNFNCARVVIAVFYIYLYTNVPGIVSRVPQKMFSGSAVLFAISVKLQGFK